jgi:ubiquinone/menaquinone biosynthesis C-methylase UbiE
MNKLISNSSFYDEIASDYDEMISFESIVKKKKNLLKIFSNLNTKSAADIGCGTGVDSIALALNGLKISAFDPSEKMLSVANYNSKEMNAGVEFYNYSADNIPKEFEKKYDLVVSLGNTFANISEDKFSASLKRCCDILKPNGQLIIQVLNYKKILRDKHRIVNITENGNKYFIRFYDFDNEQIGFNILTFSKVKTSDYKLSSTRIYPYQLENFQSTLTSAGFTNIRFYGDLKFAEFIPYQSKDLVVLATQE